MDPNGNIHIKPEETDKEALAAFEKMQAQLEGLGTPLKPIPQRQVAKLRKMNRKARRRWYARKGK